MRWRGSATTDRWAAALWENVLSAALLGIFGSVYPIVVFSGWLPWPLLDGSPYAICIGAGVIFSVAAFVTLKSIGKRFGCILLILMTGGPFVGMVLGVAGNAILDQSPSVQRETTFLGDIVGKGPSTERFASWRTRGQEERLRCPAFDYKHLCFALEPGQPVIINTRRGAFGWEWIDGVTPR